MGDSEDPGQATPNTGSEAQVQRPAVLLDTEPIWGEAEGGEEKEREQQIEKDREPIFEPKTSNEGTRTVEWLQLAVNGVLAVVGVVAVIIYWNQLNTMSKTLTEVKNQTTQIQIQANAAQSQLTQQQDAFKVTERAWVSVAGTGFDYKRDDGGISRARGSIVLINTGPTPAFNSSIWSCFQVRPNEPIVGKTIPNNRVCQAQFVGNLGTNVTMKLIRIDPTRVVQENGLPQNDDVAGPRLYVWGRITYSTFAKDGFHFTSFCLKSSGSQLAPCANGNDGS